ncbi:NYN domain-containing protein [Mycolicibacter algericus]|uniref:RNA-binding protein n=2 Tax=Mycolicibacter algericus TaxID=1288388 RepID=A0A7I9Y8X7_MYCAL|nr:NYN domain-containing protein [Mycolicibacter algericus]OQZ93199.1 RNA-binding protein [Mycolicibacter algericus DSM 45454]GFG85012.1 RNA-binding protein [Mycolicibacter algericus]
MRWIVDAMNVIGSRPDGWWKDRGAAMVRLTRQLEQWATAENQRVTVVFEKPPSPPISSEVVGIAAAPRAGADSADDEIVRLVRADDCPHDIIVVTSDLGLAQRVTEAGAASLPASRFRDLLEET